MHGIHAYLFLFLCCAGDFVLSLECVNESEHRKDAVRIIGQSLPNKLSITPDEINSNYAVRGNGRIPCICDPCDCAAVTV